MKKIILSALAICAFTFANAQDKAANEGFAKGDVFVSGSLMLSSDKTGDVKSNSFELAPKVGYFVTENIAVGVKVGFGNEKDKAASVTTTDNTSFVVGAFGRYYFTPASKFSLFANLGVDMTSMKDKLADAKSKELEIGLGAGIHYFVSNHFAIETSIGALSYTSNDNGGHGAEKTNSFNFGGNWTAVTFGVNYKF